ncbi:histidine kinase [Bifidobacterium sp. ESL0790]|uniref:DUF7134 domain-containing protein n=1 Tax=Bifidobacterium sp. ESL0790 TaxID=2983233 RepID=UPI0023F71E6B|nr:histidine kinase [Bifidobacterium sp. ESL0790]WEV72979.1 histidine kinase [Bifidobacterium sp. ESL0790]
MGRLAQTTAWLRHHPVVGDALLAALTLYFAFLSWGYEPGLLIGYSRQWQFAWSCALVIPLIFRRTFPRASTLGFAALVVLQLLTGPVFALPDVMAVVMLYSVIVYGEPKQSRLFILLALVIAVAAAPIIAWGLEIGPLLGSHVSLGMDQASSTYQACQVVYKSGMSVNCGWKFAGATMVVMVPILIALLAACFIAYWTRARHATARLLRERNQAIAAREEEERRIARTAERARIARDMHDVVAHTLSTVIVQSDGGRYAGAHDPEVARKTMMTIRHESRRALDDMNDLLDVFVSASDGGRPGYRDIAALVSQADTTARQEGGDVTRQVTGEARPDGLGEQTGFAVYRAVQEALTNSRKYAGPGAHVSVDERWTDDELHVAIRDDGRGATAAADGHRGRYGLIGMHERIEAAGGHLAYGPRSLGTGFEVAFDVPLEMAQDAAAKSSNTAKSSKPVLDSESTRNGEDLNDREHTEVSSSSAPDSQPAAASNPDLTELPSISPITRVKGLMFSLLGKAQHVWSIWRRRNNALKRDTTENANTANGTGNSNSDNDDAGNSPVSAVTSSTTYPAVSETNWVERTSNWFERHYLLVDVVTTLILLLIGSPLVAFVGHFKSTNLEISAEYVQPTLSASYIGFAIVTLLFIVPLAFRRKFPRASALCVAFGATVSCLLLTNIPLATLFALISLYSVCLYGKGLAPLWASLLALIDSSLFTWKVICLFLGFETPIRWLLGIRSFPATWDKQINYAIVALMVGGMALTSCVIVIAAALWTRANGTNALVLRTRQEALQAEAEKQNVMAANLERERIGSQMQGEVSATLNTVIAEADAGLALLDEAEREGAEPKPEEIVKAFEAIGAQGREALHHMRQLLRVLRETGDSDDRQGVQQPLLHPVGSMNDDNR